MRVLISSEPRTSSRQIQVVNSVISRVEQHIALLIDAQDVRIASRANLTVEIFILLHQFSVDKVANAAVRRQSPHFERFADIDRRLI